MLLVIPLVFTACEYEHREFVDIPDLPDPVSFSMHILPQLEMNCSVTGCHDGTQPPNMLEEYAYQDLTGGNYVNPDSPDNSKLYEEITGSGNMSGYATDEMRALRLKWIEEGAEDN